MSTFRIDHQCPQCGAPADLVETDRLFHCPFCRVKSCLLTRDYFRYVLPAKTPAGRDLIYYPYWRFKGVLLYIRPDGNEHKFIDVNQCARPSAELPVSLGLRAQAMKLKFAAPDMAGRFIPPAHSFAETLAAFKERFARNLPKPVVCSAHLGDSIGLLYAPFYTQDDLLYDAVLDEPLGPSPADASGDSGAAGGLSGWAVDFVPALCPDCGWDLEGRRDALVLHCRNCSASWQLSGGKLDRLEVNCLAGSEPGMLHLPFWQISCAISGLTLETCADLIKAANLPKQFIPSSAGAGFRFWTPAFKLRAPAFLRLAEGLTLSQIQELLSPGLPPTDHHPVTLAAWEACECLKVILAGFIKPRNILAAVNIEPKGLRLSYLPFAEDHLDYIQPMIRLALNKSQLSLSRNL